MDKIQGKIVAITGAAVGLGYKYAEDLLRNGAKVSFYKNLISNDRNVIRLKIH